MTTGWTEDRVSAAREMWDVLGLTAQQIADRLACGITRSAVCSKARRDGWNARPHERKGGRPRQLPLAFSDRDLINEPVIDQLPGFSWNSRGHHLLRNEPLPVVNLTQPRSFRKAARRFMRWRAAQQNMPTLLYRPGEDNSAGLVF